MASARSKRFAANGRLAPSATRARDARVTRRLTTESPGPLEQLPARIDTHDLAPAPDQRGEVANDDARAASHLEDPRARV
mgnify:CR=1 FL=1